MNTNSPNQASSNGPAAPSVEQIVHDYAPRVYNLARRLLGNSTDAEDVTQDVLLQVVRKLATFRGDASLPTWLHRITVNTALNHRLKRSLREDRELHDPLEHFAPGGHHPHTVRPWSVPPEMEAIDHEMQHLLEDAIARLPQAYRDVYVLADVEQLAPPEIAEMLGLSVSAVKNRLHRGRLLIRHTLAPYFEERVP